jgi:hypothetical protein
MPRNDKPTETGRPRQRQGGAVNAPNEKYEHQDYPKMLYGPRGTTVSVSDPDEEAEALEGGFVEDRTELEGETILATAESGEQAAKGMARGVLPKSTSKSKMANRQQTGGKDPGQTEGAGQDTATLQARIKELEEENGQLMEIIEESSSSVTEDEGASGSDTSEGAGVAPTKKAQAQAAAKKPVVGGKAKK